MARIRTIKPTVWTDDRFIELSRDARLLCLGMLSNADDDGRLVASPVALIGAIYPHDDVTLKQVEKWRDEIEASGIIGIYRVGKAVYAHFTIWAGEVEHSPRANYWTHQVINKRTSSKLPVPPPPPTTGVATGASTEQGREQAPSKAGSGSLPEVDFEVEADPGSRSKPPHHGSHLAAVDGAA